MLSLHKKHARFLVVATMHLVLEHLIKIFIHVIVLEREPYQLVPLVSLFPLSDLGDQTSSSALIYGMGIMFFSGSGFVSQEHIFPQFLHCLHHQVERVL